MPIACRFGSSQFRALTDIPSITKFRIRYMENNTHRTLTNRAQTLPFHTHEPYTHKSARARVVIIYWEILMVNFHSMPFGERIGEKWTHFIVQTWKNKNNTKNNKPTTITTSTQQYNHFIWDNVCVCVRRKMWATPRTLEKLFSLWGKKSIVNQQR